MRQRESATTVAWVRGGRAIRSVRSRARPCMPAVDCGRCGRRRSPQGTAHLPSSSPLVRCVPLALRRPARTINGRASAHGTAHRRTRRHAVPDEDLQSNGAQRRRVKSRLSARARESRPRHAPPLRRVTAHGGGVRSAVAARRRGARLEHASLESLESRCAAREPKSEVSAAQPHARIERVQHTCTVRSDPKGKARPELVI